MSRDPEETARMSPPPPHHDPVASEPRREERSRPDVGVMAPHGRPGVYIYPFWQRTEFWVMLLTALAIMIATAIEDGFPAQAGWTLITILAAAYILSRGLAKREPRDDDGDRPWTPGGGPGR